MITLRIKTHAKTQLLDVTSQIEETLARENFTEGLCFIHVPHTTAAVTINENADPDVPRDMLMVLNDIIPWKGDYRHMEGNSPAHVKSSLVGASETVAVEKGRMVLGTWQGVFFCEFDGPRTRKLHIKLIDAGGRHSHC